MHKGDILIIRENNTPEYTSYIMYDRHLAISYNIWGIKLLDIDSIKKAYIILTPSNNITFRKRADLNKILIEMITGSYSIDLNNKRNFLSHILSIYDNILGIKILENPVNRTVDSISKSDKLIMVHSNDQFFKTTF